MRGNLVSGRRFIFRHGSIPAHAGKPGTKTSPSARTGVYPRACGETWVSIDFLEAIMGLSPRMRGNREKVISEIFNLGSIPAHAGKPRGDQGLPARDWVYPRACGETLGLGIRLYPFLGLSPRMRGNQIGVVKGLPHLGSIPAHAGKPRGDQGLPARDWVYPRACGETLGLGIRLYPFLGLSPRMRGNQRELQAVEAGAGSIPAHAGKPSAPGLPRKNNRVYPRACGETTSKTNSDATSEGLSPRMRGNLIALLDARDLIGSIPAHAGKPSQGR